MMHRRKGEKNRKRDDDHRQSEAFENRGIINTGLNNTAAWRSIILLGFIALMDAHLCIAVVLVPRSALDEVISQYRIFT